MMRVPSRSTSSAVSPGSAIRRASQASSSGASGTGIGRTRILLPFIRSVTMRYCAPVASLRWPRSGRSRWQISVTRAPRSTVRCMVSCAHGRGHGLGAAVGASAHIRRACGSVSERVSVWRRS
ncbi:hypothetical protein GCM10009565_48240 [Amycolatopsis albidoflavus]